LPSLSPRDLDELDRLATAASAGPYHAVQREGMGPEDPETGEPGPGWWLDGPDWQNAGMDDEFLMFSEADARYWQAMEPERVRELVRLARIGLTVPEPPPI
jgi:hypothetical protein